MPTNEEMWATINALRNRIDELEKQLAARPSQPEQHHHYHYHQPGQPLYQPQPAHWNPPWHITSGGGRMWDAPSTAAQAGGYGHACQ